MPDNLLALARSLGKSERMKVLRALAAFEIKMMKLEVPDAEVYGILANYPEDIHYRLALIDLHYAGNGYFLDEGQLLRDAGRIAHIPAILINGRYDMVCPPLAAWEVHTRLDRSELVIVEQAGHVEGEEGITAALIEAAAKLE
jgi:pimeloyl-ACP methyl ester carboxylesterase